MKLNKIILDPFLIIGVLFSIVLSLILYITGLETFSSILIALLGTVITLQIDQITRSEQIFQKSTQYSELWEKLESPSWLYPLITEIIEAVHSVLSDSKSELFASDLFANAAKLKLESCRDYVQEASRGYLRTDYDDIEYLISASEIVQTSIRAVTVPNVDRDFWDSSIGQRWLEANQRAIARGVKVERIFVYEKWTEQLQRLAERQDNDGVEIYTIAIAQVPADLCIDMGIFDDAFTYQSELNSDGVPIKNMFSVNKYDANEKIRMFNRVKAFCDKVSKHTETIRP